MIMKNDIYDDVMWLYDRDLDGSYIIVKKGRSEPAKVKKL